MLVATAAVAAITGLAFASGIVSLSQPSEDTHERERGDDADALESLGYAGATRIRAEDMGKSGVVEYQRDAVSPGKNLVIPCGWGREAKRAGLKTPTREARLFDMEGNIVHTWTHQYPGTGDLGWANAKIGPEGDLYVIHARTGLLRLDWDSNLVWARDEFYHHDLDFLPDGTVVTLVEERRTVAFQDARHDIVDNGIAFVSPSGELERIVWLWDVLREEPWLVESFREQVDTARARKKTKFIDVSPDTELGHKKLRGGFDIMHANTIEVVRSESETRWKPGDILTSLRTPDEIVVIDPEQDQVRWSWGHGVLDDQHDPSILPGGNLMVFDNGKHRKRSRAIEIDPETGRIVWKFDGTEDRKLFSEIRGQAEPLDNGNVLVVESQAGHVLEVTRNGQVVWEYFGTDTYADHRIALRMHRLQDRELELVDRQFAEVSVPKG